MRPARKIMLAGALVAIAFLAALPFQRGADDLSREEPRQTSGRRWRESRAPIPLRMQSGQSPAVNLASGEEETGQTPPQMGFGRVIADPPALPRISATYQPLLDAPRVDTPSEITRVAAADEAFPAERSALATADGDGSAEPQFRVVRHRIRDGDTLQSIAARYLGDGSRYLDIYQWNKQQLPSAEILPLDAEVEIRIAR